MGYGKTYKTKWLEDLSGNQGTANQVLISTSAGIAWATASTVIGGPYLPLSGGTMTGNTAHGDNVRSLYGASSDMQIYHDGANSYVRDVGTGRLWIDSNGEGVSIISDGSGSTPMAHFYKDGAVELYHNNVRRFRTNDLGGVSIAHTSGSMGNSFFGAVSGATNGFQIANSSSNEMTYTFQNGSNSQVLKILNNGNVGIGTTSPGYKLHVQGTSFFFDQAIFDDKVGIGTTSPSEKIDVQGNIKLRGTNSLIIGSTYNGGNFSLSSGIRGFNFANNNGDLVRIDASGNVGIGTTSPSGQLHINTESAEPTKVYIDGEANQEKSIQIRHYDTSEGSGVDRNLFYLKTTAAGRLDLGGFTDGNTEFTTATFLENGNVGIGTDTPSNPLTVVGVDSVGIDDYILHNGDSNTKFGFPSNDSFKIRTAGSDRFYINSSGNVGIGTTSPITKLHIDEAGTSLPALYMETARYGISVIGDGTSNSQYLLNLQSNGGSTDVMRVQSSGNVGIGTTSPDAILHLKGSTDNTEVKIDTDNNALGDDALIKFNGARAQVGWIDAAVTLTDGGGNKDIKLKVNTGSVFLQTNNTTRLTIADGGNVGIGTTSPSQRAVVSGPDTAPSLNTTSVSSASLLVSNSDTGYGTYFGSTANGIGLIQQRRQTSETYYDLSLNPYGGNVGIGTSSPSHKLDVTGSARLIDSSPTLTLQDSDESNVFASIIQSSGSLFLRSRDGSSNGSIVFQKQNSSGITESMRIDDSGNVGIGTTSPTASALFEVASTTKGVLLPRMNTTQINAISSPAEGLTVYNTLLSTLCFFNGVSWQKVTSTAM